MKFRKKPVQVEAILWDETPRAKEALVAFCKPAGAITFVNDEPLIQTLEGLMHVSKGDWVIRGVKGEFYPCKPEIFAETYERVEEEPIYSA